jgi:peptidoglycan/xylan/chitin deacetylase (PgdA/CDA1 family)
VGIMNSGFQAAGEIFSAGGSGGGLRILFYHSVLPEPDPLQPPVPHAALFDAQAAMLRRFFNVLPLEEAVDALVAGSLPPRAACITFDDGYRNNFEVAYPILRRHRLTATFFVASGLIGNGLLYNDAIVESVRRLPDGSLDLSWLGLGSCRIDGAASRREAIEKLNKTIKYLPLAEREGACDRLRRLAPGPLPDDLMLRPEQIREMARHGMTIGGHTESHPILTRLTPEQARAEIEQDRARLASILGEAPLVFAYPNGKPGTDFDNSHVEMLWSAGYRTAVTTAWGVARPADCRLRLPRICLQEHGSVGFVARLLNAGRRAVSPRDRAMMQKNPVTATGCAGPAGI